MSTTKARRIELREMDEILDALEAIERPVAKLFRFRVDDILRLFECPLSFRKEKGEFPLRDLMLDVVRCAESLAYQADEMRMSCEWAPAEKRMRQKRMRQSVVETHDIPLNDSG